MDVDKAKKTFAKNLLRQLDKKGLTCLDLARELQLNRSTVYSWSWAQYFPRVDMLLEMCEFFGISIGDFFKEEDMNAGNRRG